MRYAAIGPILKQTFSYWSADKVPRIAAALAYYTAFSLTPLLIIIIAIASIGYGKIEAKTKVLEKVNGLFGVKGAEQIKLMLESASNPTSSMIATILGFIVLIFGAIGVFVELQDGMNTIWGVQAKPNRGWYVILKDRFLSLTMVMAIGFLLLVSLVLSTIINAIAGYLSHSFHGVEMIWFVTNFIFSLTLISLLFAIIFKILPDVYIRWRDVYFSGFVTALLFTIGKLALELYLTRSNIGSSYGAAGSLIVILVWVYYSAQILFFGAELTKVIAIRNGSKIKPARHAMFINK